MKLWFAPGSEVPLYRQLCTQIVLAILSKDVKPGEKLPSTRSLSRRFDIHPNTVSAAYQQLEKEGWVESRRGSGVYVIEGGNQQLTPERQLDIHISGFFRAVRELELPMEVVRAQVARWLAAPPPDHLLLIEADETLAPILQTELSELTSLPVKVISPEHCRANRKHLRGAVPVCRPSRKAAAEEAIGQGVELIVLPINSAGASLVPLVSSTGGRLVAIVSEWSDFVDIARTMLIAAGVSADALLAVDAKESGWNRGLESVHAVLCDARTARRRELPAGPKRFVFRLIAESLKDMLRPYEDAVGYAGAVTPEKAS